MTNEIVETRYILRQNLIFVTTHVFENSYVVLAVTSDRVSVCAHLTREEAMALSRNLEEIVAAYDATVDRYHEVCDEPAVSA